MPLEVLNVVGKGKLLSMNIRSVLILMMYEKKMYCRESVVRNTKYSPDVERQQRC